MRSSSGALPRDEHTATVNHGCGSRNSLRPNKCHGCGVLALDAHPPLLLSTDGSALTGVVARAGGSGTSARWAVGAVIGGGIDVPDSRLFSFFATGLGAWPVGTGRLHLDFHCVVKFLEGGCESAA